MEVRRRLVGSRLCHLRWIPASSTWLLVDGIWTESCECSKDLQEAGGAWWREERGGSIGAQTAVVACTVPWPKAPRRRLSARSRPLMLTVPSTPRTQYCLRAPCCAETALRAGTRAYSTNKKGGKANNSCSATRRAPLHHSKTAYYDILAVASTATQAQIKTAYYKQSFVYHPDRNAGNEDAVSRFSEISEAYLVLGNVALRKKYDRGILSQEDLRSADKPSGKVESPTTRRRTQTTSARYSPTKPVFDFDEFYRAHYGEQLERERFMRWKREELRKRKLDLDRKFQLSKLSELSALALFLAAIYIFLKWKPSS
ncbi:dnaJ homolog subfamily C member 30, mitochondrial [Rhinatrema bivittatum]|uniref:dnaJ homolog subfamily C member 30, mitochondrial n=1 Tax=Rhinatrema bivittatum TaxID=194408 RepID=UPI00112C941C|nr:dnaJ homolog subfamily C member 30, mitochondrial [Rhinatrema bivittatum]